MGTLSEMDRAVFFSAGQGNGKDLQGRAKHHKNRKYFSRSDKRIFAKGWLAIAKLKPLSLFISLF